MSDPSAVTEPEPATAAPAPAPAGTTASSAPVDPIASSAPVDPIAPIEPIEPATAAFIAGLPKVELHVHLEGSLGPATRARLARRHGLTLTARPPGVGFADFGGFIDAFMEGMELLRDGEDIVTAIEDLAVTLAAQQVRYAEVTTTAWTYLVAKGIAAEAYREALAEGRSRAGRLGVELAWVIDIPRGFEGPEDGVTAAFLCGPNRPEATVAIGLGGAEIGFPAGDYRASFERATAAGLHRVPHGGETAGADYVLDCLDLLGAERIGHGISAIASPEALGALVDRQVPLEVCLSSNVLLHVVDSHRNHPLGALREAGVRITLATDDPGYFATDLNRELGLAHRYHGYDLEALIALQLDSVDMSFLDAAAKARLRRELTDYRSAQSSR